MILEGKIDSFGLLRRTLLQKKPGPEGRFGKSSALWLDTLASDDLLEKVCGKYRYAALLLCCDDAG